MRINTIVITEYKVKPLSYFEYFSYIVAVSFIGGGDQTTRRKPPTCHKSLTNIITQCCILYTLQYQVQFYKIIHDLSQICNKNNSTSVTNETWTANLTFATVFFIVLMRFVSFVLSNYKSSHCAVRFVFPSICFIGG